MDHRKEIVVRPEVLDESFLPELIPARKQHLERLRKCVAPAFNARKPLHALITGPSGSGKTLLARAILEKLTKKKVPCAYVNCLHHNTLYSVVSKIIQDLQIPHAERIDAGFKIQAVTRSIEKKALVIVLDELHGLQPKERHLVLYCLANMGKSGLVCIAEDKHFYEALPEQLKSRLYPTKITLLPYETGEITEIIRARVREGFREQVLPNKNAQYLASQAAGNARIALQILRKAVSFADQDSAQKLTKRHIERGSVASNGAKHDYVLGQNPHYRIIFEVIQESPGIVSGKLWAAYNRSCTEREIRPVASRTFHLYLRRLLYLKLLRVERAEMQGNVRKYYTGN